MWPGGEGDRGGVFGLSVLGVGMRREGALFVRSWWRGFRVSGGMEDGKCC